MQKTIWTPLMTGSKTPGKTPHRKPLGKPPGKNPKQKPPAKTVGKTPQEKPPEKVPHKTPGTRNTTLDDIGAIIGVTATLKLSAWFSVINTLYVPAEMDPDHRLAHLIGFAAAKRLAQEWGGETVAIPTVQDPYKAEVRRRRIGRMFEQNFGSREIALDQGIDERRVQQICRELEAAGLIKIVVGKRKAGRPIGAKNKE